jgi:hypothetical protein
LETRVIAGRKKRHRGILETEVVACDIFPLLGTGKLDLRKVKELAARLSTTDGHG